MYFAGNGVSGVLRVKRNSGVLNANSGRGLGGFRQSGYCRSRWSGRTPDVNILRAVRHPQTCGFGAGGILTNCIGIPNELYGCSADGIAVGIGVVMGLTPNLIRSLHAGGKQGLNIGYIRACCPYSARCIIGYVVIVLKKPLN